jgi:hypothetical protein
VKTVSLSPAWQHPLTVPWRRRSRRWQVLTSPPDATIRATEAVTHLEQFVNRYSNVEHVTGRGGGPTVLRVFFAMSRDRLLPAIFSKVNERTGTPIRTTVTTGVGIAVISTFVPLSELADTARGTVG